MYINSSPAYEIGINNILEYNEVPAKGEKVITSNGKNSSPAKNNFKAIAFTSAAITAIGIAAISLSRGRINIPRLLAGRHSQSAIQALKNSSEIIETYFVN
ncbi:hypothetical protein IJ182_05710 [bacterium]|nr:hypothetical protein [bacterium]